MNLRRLFFVIRQWEWWALLLFFVIVVLPVWAIDIVLTMLSRFMQWASRWMDDISYAGRNVIARYLPFLRMEKKMKAWREQNK
jgi:hypothetical protein